MPLKRTFQIQYFKWKEIPHSLNCNENGYKLWMQWDRLGGQALVMIGEWWSRQPLTTHNYLSTQTISKPLRRKLVPIPLTVSGVGNFLYPKRLKIPSLFVNAHFSTSRLHRISVCVTYIPKCRMCCCLLWSFVLYLFRIFMYKLLSRDNGHLIGNDPVRVRKENDAWCKKS